MPLELKFDEEGKAVFVEKDGAKLPVYIDPDDPESEIEVDVPGLFSRITDVSAEAKKYRKEKAALKVKFKFFDEIEDIDAWLEESNKARETVKNFNDKQLVDAGKVDEIKKQMKEVHAEEIENVHNSYKQAITDKEGVISKKDDTIYKLLVSSKFAQSKYFSGESPVTLLPPEIGETYFGKYFKVEEDDKGELREIGYNKASKQILSKKNPGDLADFDECMDVILNEYPKKDSIIRSSGAGSGSGGGSGASQPTGVDAKIAKLQAAYDEAFTAKDGKRSIALKNQIHELQTKKRLGLLK